MLQRSLIAVLVGVLAFHVVACGDDSQPAPASTGDGPDAGPDNNGGEPEPVFLTPTDHLTRASLALKGTRPSAEELERVREDESSLDEIVDGYLQSDEFATTIRNLHDEAWLLRTFLFMFPPRGELGDLDMTTLNRSVQEQPLRLAEHIVMNDRPYSEIVTADYTVADGIVATVWGMDYEGDGVEWTETHWPQEGRTHAGILSESMVWTRHYSTPLNAQRSRANQVSKALLCFDFLDSDVRVDGNIDLSDPDAIKNAVRNEPCSSCHASLDPLAGHLWEFEYFYFPAQVITDYPVAEDLSYKPEYVEIHKPYFTDGVTGYFGQESETLADLGQHIADDPRFTLCTARRFYSYFAQVDLKDVPVALEDDLRRQFIQSGLSGRALAKAVVMSDAFRRRATAQDPDADPVKRLRPRSLTRAVQALTGFSWRTRINFPLFQDHGIERAYGGFDLMEDSLWGFEVIAGGRDDYVVTRSRHTTNPTASLVFRSMAREAAGYVVEEDCGRDAEARRLLHALDCASSDESDIREELARLHLIVLSEFAEPDGHLVDESYGLWRALYEDSGDTERAWAAVLTAFFQDTRFLHY
jgi:hypothetical protein